MKIYVFVLLIVTAIAVAFPTEEKDITIDSPDFLPQEKDESLKLQDTSIKEHSRTRRFTCDFLSGFGVDHSACASHCYLRGKSGGRCDNNRVCVCRAKSIFG